MCSVRRTGRKVLNENPVYQPNTAIWSPYMGGCTGDETDLLQCYSPTIHSGQCRHYTDHVAVSCDPSPSEHARQ